MLKALGKAKLARFNEKTDLSTNLEWKFKSVVGLGSASVHRGLWHGLRLCQSTFIGTKQASSMNKIVTVASGKAGYQRKS